jgi:hypothetical protein
VEDIAGDRGGAGAALRCAAAFAFGVDLRAAEPRTLRARGLGRFAVPLRRAAVFAARLAFGFARDFGLARTFEALRAGRRRGALRFAARFDDVLAIGGPPRQRVSYGLSRRILRILARIAKDQWAAQPR